MTNALANFYKNKKILIIYLFINQYYWKSEVPMEDNTTYRYSYWDGPRPLVEPIKPKDWLTVGDGCITDETTHKVKIFLFY